MNNLRDLFKSKSRVYQTIDFSDMEGVLNGLFSDFPRTDYLRHADQEYSIVTMGSCFALNLGKEFKNQGRKSFAYGFAETVNTPYTNLAFLDYAIHGESSEFAGFIDEHRRNARSALISDIDPREDLLPAVRSAKMIILTLGVGIQWIDATGKVVMFPTGKMSAFKTTYPTVSEQQETVEKIISRLRTINPRTLIYLTLSPVPLEFSLNYRSAIISDCVSKSILRAAIHEVLKSKPTGVYYWPSFEFVRWVSGHLTKRAFGADDGKVRHVSNEFVSILVKKFIEVNSIDPDQVKEPQSLSVSGGD